MLKSVAVSVALFVCALPVAAHAAEDAALTQPVVEVLERSEVALEHAQSAHAARLEAAVVESALFASLLEAKFESEPVIVERFVVPPFSPMLMVEPETGVPPLLERPDVLAQADTDGSR